MARAEAPVESRSNWSRFEKLTLAIAALIFLLALYCYVTHFPLRRYLFGILDEGADVRIGLATLASGELKRQRIGTGEFVGLNVGANLYDLDTIVTGEGGTAELELDGGARITVGPNSMIKLAFDTRYTLAGVTRTQRVQVLQGNVQGVGGANPVVIQTAKKVTQLAAAKPNQPKPVFSAAAAPAPVARPSLSPLPLPPVTRPSPTAPPIAKVQGQIEIIAPAADQVFTVDAQTLTARVPLQWKLPADFPGTLQVVAEIHVEVSRLYKEEGVDKQEVVFQKVITPEGPASVSQVDVGPNRPGDYSWRVYVPQTELAASSKFKVSPDFEGITLKDPLIGGRATNNNRYSGSLIRDFAITVGWEPYPAAKPDASYRIRFYERASGGRSIYEARAKGDEFEINRGKVLKGRVFYEVSTPAGSGFTAKSKRRELSFLFDPPLLTQPADGATVAIEDIKARGGTLLLTWQKTNFTDSYDLELATEPTFKSVALKHKSTENFFAVKASRPGKYYWRVRSVAKGSASTFSSPFSFSVENAPPAPAEPEPAPEPSPSQD